MRRTLPALILVLGGLGSACATGVDSGPKEVDIGAEQGGASGQGAGGDGQGAEAGVSGAAGAEAGSAGQPAGASGAGQAGQGESGASGQPGAGSGGAGGEAGAGGDAAGGSEAGGSSAGGASAGGSEAGGSEAGGSEAGGAAGEASGAGGAGQAGDGGSAGEASGQGGTGESGASGQGGDGGTAGQGAGAGGSGGSGEAGAGGSGGSGQAGAGGSGGSGGAGGDAGAGGSGGSGAGGSGGAGQGGVSGASGQGGSAGTGADKCPGEAVEVGVELVKISANNKVGVTNDYEPPCNSSDGRELVYAMTASVSGVLSLALEGAAGVDPILFVRGGGCTNGSSLGCSDGISGSAIEKLDVTVKAGSTYHVFADSYSTEAGDFTLTAQVFPAPDNDTCATAQEVPVAPGPATVLQGTTLSATHDTTGSKCGGSAKARDVFYKVTPSVAGDLRIRLDASASFDSVLYAYQTSCGVAASEVACKDAAGKAAEEVTLAVKPGEPIWVAVDAYSASDSGPFSLEVQLTEAPSNDDCATAQVVDLAPGSLTIDATTTAATHQYTGTCGTLGQSAEVVYQIKPAVAGKVTATLVGSYDSVLYGWSGSCGPSGKSLGCDDDVSVGAPESFSFSADPSQSYWLVVDGYNGKEGPFSLSLDLVAAPSNDTCAGAIAINLGTGQTLDFSGDTSAAIKDYSVCPTVDGGDVVFVVTPSVSGKLTVTFDAGGGFDPILYAGSGACGTGPQIGSCQDSSGAGGVETLTINNAVAGTAYWVIAGGYKKSGGPYTASFKLQ